MKVFVLGAGGMLGHKIYGQLKRNFDTWAIARAKFETYGHFNLFDSAHFVGGLDFMDIDALTKICDHHLPDVLINCAGLTTRKIAPENSADVIHINALLPHQLYRWAKLNGKRVIHFSTDCVFSGESGPYAESAKPDAPDLYGRSKLLGELGEAPALTIRSSIIGRELNHHTELVEWLVSQRGKSVIGFNQVYYSGVTTGYMAYLVEKILRHPKSIAGVFHLGSPRISKFELLNLINQQLKLNVEIKPDASKISDKSLIGNRLLEILGNVDKPLWPQMIAELVTEDKFYREP